LQVFIQVARNTDAGFEVMDMSGRVLFREQQWLTKGSHTLQFHKAVEIPDGLYILRVQYDGMILTRKFNKLP
jgi:hypothetical protein